MKTAAEFWELLKRDPAGPGVGPTPGILDWIRAIQLEAYRAGEASMRERAAVIITPYTVRSDAIRALPLSDEVPK